MDVLRQTRAQLTAIKVKTGDQEQIPIGIYVLITGFGDPITFMAVDETYRASEAHFFQVTSSW